MFPMSPESLLLSSADQLKLKTKQGYWNVKLERSQTHDACAVPAIILQKKIQSNVNVESFTLTAKHNAISENLSFLL